MSDLSPQARSQCSPWLSPSQSPLAAVAGAISGTGPVLGWPCWGLWRPGLQLLVLLCTFHGSWGERDVCHSGEEGLAPNCKLSRMVELQGVVPSPQGRDGLVAVGAWSRCALSRDWQARFPMFSWQGPGNTGRSSFSAIQRLYFPWWRVMLSPKLKNCWWGLFRDCCSWWLPDCQ